MSAPIATQGQGEYVSGITDIVIRFIPEGEMRIPGVGDWRFYPDALHVNAAGATPDERFLVALHELVEAWLCHRAGVAGEAVDAHDVSFEAERDAGLHSEVDEPGDDARAPYRHQHRQAMLVEMLVANFLGLTDYGTIR